jgi:hypothetical protein
MTEDPGNLNRDRPKHLFASSIGGGIGCAIGVGVCHLIPFKSFWLGLVIVEACLCLGILVQKIATK